MAQAIELTVDNFAAEVEQSDIPVLVDFWGERCPPCVVMAPVIEDLAAKYAGRAKVCKLDVGEHMPVAAYFGIRNIPTTIMFQNGQPQTMLVGLQSEEDLSAELDKLL